MPPGFKAQLLIQGLDNPTSLAFGPNSDLYIAQVSGTILRVKYDPSVPLAPPQVFARGFSAPLGLATAPDGSFYVSSRGKVSLASDADGDGVADRIQTIMSDLPNGRHQSNGLALGPDGLLYLTLGSTCDVCEEQDQRSATIMRFRPDGTAGEVYARGLRNVYDIAFHPQDGTLWGADNGRDDLGLRVPEELNLIQQGAHYGWPDCWDTGQGNNCQGTLPPIVELEPRSSANGLAFYTGQQFPSQFHLNLFIAMYGSHARDTGQKVVRVQLIKSDSRYTGVVSDFILGLDRPLDVVVAPDGALLVADFGQGRIYRVTWVGP